MPSITELALLTLPPSPNPDRLSYALFSALHRAKTAMQRSSGEVFTYLLCKPTMSQSGGGDEEQQQLFIVGGWPSVEFHMQEWIPSEENQGLVRELSGLGVGVRWMWHVGVQREVVDEEGVFGGGKAGSVRGEGGEGRVRVMVWRAAVPVDRGREMLEAVRAGSGELGLGGVVVGGLRIDEGFMAEGEEERSFMRVGELEEVVLLGRLDEEGEVQRVVWNVLEGPDALATAVQVRHCVVLDM